MPTSGESGETNAVIDAIRLAQPCDVDAIMLELTACTKQMQADAIDQWDDIYPSRSVIEAEVDARTLYLLDGDQAIQAGVALDFDQPGQYAQVNWHGDEPAVVVHHLFVSPKLWGEGIATKMMGLCEGEALRLGAKSIRLDAYLGNPAALQLYRARGYREAGEVYFPRRALNFLCFEKCISE